MRRQGVLAAAGLLLVSLCAGPCPARDWLPGGITTGPHYELDRVYHHIHFKPGEEAPDFALFPLEVIEQVVASRPELQLSTSEYRKKYAVPMRGRNRTRNPYANKPPPWAKDRKADPLEKRRVRLSSFRGKKPVLLLLGSYG